MCKKVVGFLNFSLNFRFCHNVSKNMYIVLPFLIQNNQFYLFCQKRAATNEKVFLPKASVFFGQSISRLRILLCSKTMYWQKKDLPYSRASHWFLLTKEWIQSLLRNFFSLSFLLTKEFKVYWKLFLLSMYLKCQKHFTWK